MTQPGDIGAIAAHPAAGPGGRSRRLSLSWLLALSFGSLIAVSILVVLGFAVYGAARNTVDLLRDRADLGIGGADAGGRGPARIGGQSGRLRGAGA